MNCMESPSSQSIIHSNEASIRELQISRDDQSRIEVPENGQESSDKVTKSPEPIELSGTLGKEKSLELQTQCPQPGNPMESVDNIEDAGIDCTREPDWKVVDTNLLPPEPGPSQFHNDRYWDERSLDRELQDKDLQTELIRRETEEFNKASDAGKDESRSFRNNVLDPYYPSGYDASRPPSAGDSLDSFI